MSGFKRDDPPSTERYYPVSAVARWLGVTEVSIKNWTNAGKLTAVRTAGHGSHLRCRRGRRLAVAQRSLRNR